MAKEFSLYLDLVRFSAAFLVLLSHANFRELSERIIPASDFGHSAVIIFFVLSGFVIAYVTGTKESGAKDYAASRMARIYSVALPAILLTVLVDGVGERLDPSLYEGNTTHDWWLLRVLSSTFFMNEFWGVSIQTFSNVPYWSLSYEVWYYILFGLFVFWTGPGRTWVLGAALLLCGPKILLLLPIWLMGVALYRSTWWAKPRTGPAVALYVLSWLFLIVFHWLDLTAYFAGVLKNLVGEEFYSTRMTFSKFFIGDYILGLIVVMNFASFRAAAGLLGHWLLPFSKSIRWAASFTLSLYLFHRPLLLFFTALVDGDPKRPEFFLTVLALVIASVVLLGLVTEHQKDAFKRVFLRLLTALEQSIRKRFPRLLPQT